jgi:hypothetical protein
MVRVRCGRSKHPLNKGEERCTSLHAVHQLETFRNVKPYKMWPDKSENRFHLARVLLPILAPKVFSGKGTKVLTGGRSMEL